MTLSELRRWRETRGLSRLELARLAGVGESTVRHYESTRGKQASLEAALRFATALGVEVTDLIPAGALSSLPLKDAA
jgi:transcriptional regulator with XRE-family HTH domain